MINFGSSGQFVERGGRRRITFTYDAAQHRLTLNGITFVSEFFEPQEDGVIKDNIFIKDGGEKVWRFSDLCDRLRDSPNTDDDIYFARILANCLLVHASDLARIADNLTVDPSFYKHGPGPLTEQRHGDGR